MAPVEERPSARVGMASDIPRDYQFVPELLRRGGKRVETTFVTVGDDPLTEEVDLFRLGEPWAAVSMRFQLIAEGPSRDLVVAEITDMLAERVRQREAEGEVALSFYRPDGTRLIDSEKWLRDGLAPAARKAHASSATGVGTTISARQPERGPGALDSIPVAGWIVLAIIVFLVVLLGGLALTGLL
jgi:hypothetical protein